MIANGDGNGGPGSLRGAQDGARADGRHGARDGTAQRSAQGGRPRPACPAGSSPAGTGAAPEGHGAPGTARAACGAHSRAVRRRGASHPGAPGGATPPAHGARRDPLRRLLPHALVVACLAGGTSAFVADDKAVQLSIDGKPRILRTFAADVTGLLDEEGVTIGAHDLLAPAPGTRLADGAEVAVRHARRLRLTVDGRRRQVWTTARTVGGALRVLGVRPEGAFLSVSPSRRIDRGGLALDVRTGRTVHVTADGRTRTLRTTAATVRDVVRQAGLRLHRTDTLTAAAGSFPHDGQAIAVVRVRTGRTVRSESIPFRVQRIADPRLPRGTEVVVRAGHPGALRVVYATRTVDGVARPPRRLTAEVVREPRAQRLRVGTKGRAPRADRGGRRPVDVRTRSGRILHRATAHRGTSRIDRLDWEALARCESGGRPDAVDPTGTYGGLYQFDLPTWRSLGGRGRPQDATPAEQTRRAKQLYARRGAAPWPVCGRRLTG